MTQIISSLRKMPQVKSLYTVNGVHDMLALLSAESTKSLDETLDQIGEMQGVEKTVSSIILSTKFEK